MMGCLKSFEQTCIKSSDSQLISIWYDCQLSLVKLTQLLLHVQVAKQTTATTVHDDVLFQKLPLCHPTLPQKKKIITSMITCNKSTCTCKMTVTVISSLTAHQAITGQNPETASANSSSPKLSERSSFVYWWTAVYWPLLVLFLLQGLLQSVWSAYMLSLHFEACRVMESFQFHCMLQWLAIENAETFLTQWWSESASWQDAMGSIYWRGNSNFIFEFLSVRESVPMK